MIIDFNQIVFLVINAQFMSEIGAYSRINGGIQSYRIVEIRENSGDQLNLAALSLVWPKMDQYIKSKHMYTYTEQQAHSNDFRGVFRTYMNL